MRYFYVCVYVLMSCLQLKVTVKEWASSVLLFRTSKSMKGIENEGKYSKCTQMPIAVFMLKLKKHENHDKNQSDYLLKKMLTFNFNV